MIIPSAPRRIGVAAVLAAILATIIGAAAALHYRQLGLTLSHYDARGHLIVARRIFDSITPGWQQIGAVWLPLPHLLNALPVQIDFFYRTGASGVAISIVSFAVAAGAIAWIVASIADSELAGLAAAAVFVLNPRRALPAVHTDDRTAAAGPDDVGVAMVIDRVRARGRRSSRT